MPTLLIMRHAKSSWDDSTLSDFERPLNKRGKRDAPRMGQLLSENGLLPELILSSSAVRTRETVDQLLSVWDASPEVEYCDDLYLAKPRSHLLRLREIPATCETTLLVAHNPGLEELLYLLTGFNETLPTAAIACVEIEAATWADLPELARNDARLPLRALWRPKSI
ncbi:SixA phosphatase family protein [Calycomorphotria hydatis]|uniref:Phosphohistidine phosphatase n=1 Tax=Calycomorphotria hydatis TaxID=2528027 RepID=A0A517T513_9PLAN|nr:histidine phosphatase family protein [Calycomorphotria hydatis]QDT63473.1 phosphohistidine phosphatase [Calycomorphotria hydatis]